ncbi:protein trichome birefringence-like 2 [Andrographis paniculata]|uniref:protein trichome birefringence-like 2 n=1 Tax=Andrographis paniculata TaxID=175694 RepID=UPI0021E93F16|nr:protein trichome birefringence-like 2 [Andrographis paniculata]
MVSLMDLRKLSFSDQVSSSRKRVLSSFGFGILMSFIVLSVVLYNASFKAPLLNPIFWNTGMGSNSSTSSFLSWPFSRGAEISNSVNCASNGSSLVQKSMHSVALNGTVESNVFASNKSLDSSSFDGKDAVFKDARVRNVSGDLKNATLFVGNGNGNGNVEEVKTDAKSGSPIDNSTMSEEAQVGNFKNNSRAGWVKDSEGSTVRENSIAKVEGEGASPIGTRSYKEIGNDLGKKSAYTLDGTKSSYKDCDIFNGRWVRDESKPYYPPGSCPYIDRDFDCHLNGRPDNEYEKWRWQPYGCDIPRFNSTDFLERLRGQTLVFVGDSLNRNMWESLVCMLRHGVRNKKRVYEISGRHEFKKKGFYAFRFEDYNCSIDFVSSPFLVKESSFKGKNGSFETLRLDLMDATTSMYREADILIFNTGHWWTHEKTSKGEGYYQEGNHVHARLKVLEAFKRALETWGKWVDKNIDRTKTLVIFRGYSVTHFRGGPWNSGGQCNKETEPIFNDEYLAKYPSKMKLLEYVIKDMKTPVSYLNISRLTDYRKDGHPSVYRPDYQAQREVHAQDCSHWCLPGVPDTWNQLLYVSLLQSGRGSWRGN